MHKIEEKNFDPNITPYLASSTVNIPSYSHDSWSLNVALINYIIISFVFIWGYACVIKQMMCGIIWLLSSREGSSYKMYGNRQIHWCQVCKTPIHYEYEANILWTYPIGYSTNHTSLVQNAYRDALQVSKSLVVLYRIQFLQNFNIFCMTVQDWTTCQTECRIIFVDPLIGAHYFFFPKPLLIYLIHFCRPSRSLLTW